MSQIASTGLGYNPSQNCAVKVVCCLAWDAEQGEASINASRGTPSLRTELKTIDCTSALFAIVIKEAVDFMKPI